MSRRPSTAAVLVALVATLASACTGGAGEPSAAPDPVPVKIAFLHDMSVPGSAQTVAPALLGLQLAFQEAVDRGDLPVVPEVVGLDVEGDASNATALAQSVVDDPSYVAAVIGPFWSEPTSVGALLDGAGIPTLSLSELGSSLASQGWSSWRRVVAGLPGESAALAAAIRGSSRSVGGTCLVGDGSSFSEAFGGLLATDLGTGGVVASDVLADEDALAGVVQRVDRSGCGSVAWTGFGPGATLLRTGLTEGGADAIPLFGSSAMKTESYLSTTAGAGDGTVVTCACVDLGSSTRPEVRRFIHDFQSQYGSPPGVFGPEGWDVGGMLLAAFRAGAVDRRGVAAALAGSSGYEGLANTYRFDPDGELASTSAGVRVFRAEGVRWVQVGDGQTVDGAPLPGGDARRAVGGGVSHGTPGGLLGRWPHSRDSTSSSHRPSHAGSGSRSRGASSRAGPRSAPCRRGPSTRSSPRPPPWSRAPRRRGSRSACTSPSSRRKRKRMSRGARPCSTGWARTTGWRSSDPRRRFRWAHETLEPTGALIQFTTDRSRRL